MTDQLQLERDFDQLPFGVGGKHGRVLLKPDRDARAIRQGEPERLCLRIDVGCRCGMRFIERDDGHGEIADDDPITDCLPPISTTCRPRDNPLLRPILPHRYSPDWLAPSTPQHKQRAACVCVTAEPDPAPAHCVSWKEISASVPAASKDAGRSA
jgi:hypothetical protein